MKASALPAMRRINDGKPRCFPFLQRMPEKPDGRMNMKYAFLLKPHANARYRASLSKLAKAETACLLKAWDIPCEDLKDEIIGGEPFITFTAPELTGGAFAALTGQSGICFAAERTEDGLLLPLRRPEDGFIPAELPHILKYKGKTNPDFTFLMLHTAKAASAFAKREDRLTVLDPMCGKGTSLFCALCEGHNAVGIETAKPSLQEADSFLERFLQTERLKYKKSASSLPVKGKALRKTRYEIAPDAKAQKEGNVQTLEWTGADAALTGEIVKKESCHLVICDLPYGVQHAPKENGGMSTLTELLDRVLPGCARAMVKGGAMALSFNLNTLKRADAEAAMEKAGLRPLTEAPFNDFAHWVEQAVDRDIVTGVKD